MNKKEMMHVLSGNFKGFAKRATRRISKGQFSKVLLASEFARIESRIDTLNLLGILTMDETLDFNDVLIMMNDEALTEISDAMAENAKRCIGRQVQYAVNTFNAVPNVEYFKQAVAHIDGMEHLAFNLGLLTVKEDEFYEDDILYELEKEAKII